MEIYRQTVNRISFEAPDADTNVTATGSLNGDTPITLTVEPPVADSKMRYVTLPYVNDEGTVRVEWTMNNITTFNGPQSVTVSDTYDVVTPILSDDEIKEIHPLATPPEIKRVEKAVRHIINAHTGQRFGRFVGVHEVKGNGTAVLQLPARLLSLSEVNGEAAGGHYLIGAEGWTLQHFPWGVPPIKADYYGLHQHRGGVIHNPNNVRLADFLKSRTFAIDGVWGYEEIPAAVVEAAKLLVNDYACGDNAYRDRYLTSMTAADWRIQFHDGAFAKTGNVRADQLLSDYVLKRGWAVI